MELQKHFVAFIDILGFAKYIKDNALTPDKSLQFLKQFLDLSKKFLKPIDGLKRTVFSDNVVISMLTKQACTPSDYDMRIWQFLLYINSLQMYITTAIGILPIRGGVAYGDFYHSGSELLFGEAMIEAYDLERFHAFFPRIIVKPKFLDPYKFLSANKHFSSLELPDDFPVKIPKYEPEQSLRQYPVKYDFDGVLFCNYLSSLYLNNEGWADYTDGVLNNHKIFILGNLQATDDLNITRKYIWMKNYHNWFCEPFKEFQKYIIPDN